MNENIWLRMDCSPCYREYPEMTVDKKEPCPLGNGQWDNLHHPCMAGISVDKVWELISQS